MRYCSTNLVLLVPILLTSSCFERYEVRKISESNIRVIEDGKLRRFKNVSFDMVGSWRAPVGIYMFEECPLGHDKFSGKPPCWPGELKATSRQIRRLLRTMPDYRHPDTLASLARRYPPDERVRVVLGTRPLIVGIEPRRAPKAPGYAYISLDETLHLPIEALVVHPDFGGTDEPLLIEFPEPLKIKDVLDRLAAGEEWSSFGELRTLPPLPDPPRPAKRYSPP